MSTSNQSWDKIKKNEKFDLLTRLYIDQKKSFADIASMYGTYANKIRREVVGLNIPIRDKSEAQKNALKTGKHKHPTKGLMRSEDTKNKIGMGVMKSWEDLDENELNQRKLKAKEAWTNLDEDEKARLVKLANEAVRKTSKVGSKLEKFVLDYLLKQNHKVEFHKEQALLNTKLQIDLFLPNMGIAIEIDGPSHFLPVWGEDALQKNISYDQKKQGLILGKGLILIRIKQTKDFSKTRAQRICENLSLLLDSISKTQTQTKNFLIED
jgi:very-short-patch-repair endonuclease